MTIDENNGKTRKSPKVRIAWSAAKAGVVVFYSFLPGSFLVVWIGIAVFLIAMAVELIGWLTRMLRHALNSKDDQKFQRRETERGEIKIRLMQRGIWLIAMVSMVGGFFWQKWHARQQADEMAAEIEAWRSQHGRYPLSSEIGIGQHGGSVVGLHYYHDEEGDIPLLFYNDPLMIFDTWDYDFDEKAWKYYPD